MDKIIVNTPYGKCKVNIYNYQKTNKTNIRSAINKTEYFKKELFEVFPNYTDYYNILEYINGDSVFIQDNYGLLEVKARHLKTKNIPSVLRALDKDSYIQNKLIKISPGFNYELVQYIGSNSKIIIKCKLHGEFTLKLRHALQGHSCSECGYLTTQKAKRKGSVQFIKEASFRHNNKYSYENVKLKNLKEYVIISCPHHGLFTQLASNHLLGAGCVECNKRGWSKSIWSKFCKLNNKKSFLYFVQLYNNYESFYKIGITTNINSRLNKLGYKYNVLKLIESPPEYTYDLENKIKRKFKYLKYIPQVKFPGYTECFKSKKEILKYLERL